MGLKECNLSAMVMLDLSWNSLGPQSCADVIAALSPVHTPSLKKLRMSYNNAGEKVGHQYMYEGLLT